MQGTLFIYTRLEKFDYRLIYAPDRTSLPSPIRDSFIDFAREVVNTDNVNNGEIKSPRWALIKEGNHILIGLGCYNRDLGAETSGTEKRIIRGFFGIYFDNPCLDALSELMDLNLYRHIYAQYIQPLWSLSKKDEYKTNSVIQTIDVTCSHNSNTSSIQLNEQCDKCLTISDDVSIDTLFRSALMHDKVDIVCNLNTIEHVTYASLYSFHNITVVGNKGGKVIVLSKENKEVSSHSSFTESNFQELKESESNERKKPSSPKHNYQESQNGDGEIEYYVDILLRKLRCCKISIENFLRVLAKKCGYNLIPQEDTTSEVDSGNFVTHENQDDLSLNQQELVASKEIEQFENEKCERRANMANLRRQYFDQTAGNQGTHSIEELAEIDNQQQQDNESVDNGDSNTDSPISTLKIEEI